MSAETLENVSHLHARKPDHETYQDFYALYGAAREGAAILLNRVLYIDETKDHSTHLIVTQQRDSGGFMTPVIGAKRPNYRVHYDPREILVATTDGETILTYHALSVQGLYRGHINKTYKPVHEHLQVNFMTRPDGEQGRLDFNLSSGRGSFSLGERALGWILSREESAQLRSEALTTELAAHIDHAVGF
jgi:hypothetical protein